MKAILTKVNPSAIRAMEIEIKKKILMKACKMSREEIRREVNGLIDAALDKTLSASGQARARAEATEYVRILRRR